MIWSNASPQPTGLELGGVRKPPSTSALLAEPKFLFGVLTTPRSGVTGRLKRRPPPPAPICAADSQSEYSIPRVFRISSSYALQYQLMNQSFVSRLAVTTRLRWARVALVSSMKAIQAWKMKRSVMSRTLPAHFTMRTLLLSLAAIRPRQACHAISFMAVFE